MQQEKGSIPVVRLTTQSGMDLVVGALTAGQIAEHHVIARRDSRTKTGYQREVSPSRVNQLMKALRNERVDLPTSILINLREFEVDRHLRSEGGQLYLVLGPGDQLHVVDGQHRVESLRRLVEEDPARWTGFKIPFVAMLGTPEMGEVKQFYVVNSTAKSVRTDLALDLLKQRAEQEHGLMEDLIETGQVWKVKCQELAELLRETEVWRHRIRFPGDAPGATTIRSTGIVNSLRPLVTTAYFGAHSSENQIRMLVGYWRGIKQVIPEIFDDPGDYVMQKSTGVMVMHTLLVNVIEYLRSAGLSVIEPDGYAKALEGALLRLEGDTAEGEPVSGSDFWLAGSSGAAGSYSSNAGKRVLVAKLRSMLPAMEIE